MVWMYNGTSSTMFIDGKKLDLPASLAKRYASDHWRSWLWQIGKFKCFKIHYGGFQQRLGAPWGADGWMLNYTGLMDEFRIYNALSDNNEVVAL
jgi:hypothetical protein